MSLNIFLKKMHITNVHYISVFYFFFDINLAQLPHLIYQINIRDEMFLGIKERFFVQRNIKIYQKFNLKK